MDPIYQEDFPRPYTHLRVLAARMSPIAPAVLELCRAEVVLDDERIRFSAPQNLHLSTTADEGEEEGRPRYRSTPLLLTQTLWTPGPPHVLASYDPAIWKLFPSPLLGAIARLDVQHLVRQIWPEAPSEDLAATLEYLGMTGMEDRVPKRAPDSALQVEVRSCMALLTTLYTTQGGSLLLLRDAAQGAPPAWVGPLLGPQAPDTVLGAMIDLAALPVATEVTALPDLAASNAAWAVVPVDTLIWVAGQTRLSRALRQRADAELGRRVREQVGVQPPNLILRRTGRLARI